MNDFLKKLNRPEYFFQPGFVWNKLFFNDKSKTTQDGVLPLRTSFGLNIICFQQDNLGVAISSYGVYDLVPGEIMHRLIRKGDTCIDIGANIGYYTGLFAMSTGSTGKVISFEPNPRVVKLLERNIHSFSEQLGYENIDFHEIGLSNENGFFSFTDDQSDSGLSQISVDVETKNKIKVEKLDDIIKSDKIIKLMKIDVEGHELQCLQGSKRILSAKQIINILYEDHAGYPSEVSNLLESFGYKIFSLHRTFLKPKIDSPSKLNHSSFEPPNYLATLDDKFVKEVLKPKFWRTFKTKL